MGRREGDFWELLTFYVGGEVGWKFGIFFSVPAASVLFIYLPSQSMGARICFKSCFYFYHSHLSFYGFNRPSMTSLPPSEVFAVTYFHQTSFLTKNKKFPSNKARPSISEFYFSVVMRWSREQAGGTHRAPSVFLISMSGLGARGQL